MGKIGTRNDIASDLSDIRVLKPEDVPRLRIAWSARFVAADLHDLMRTGPRLSVWNTKTGEYLVGERWRHRDEVSTVAEIVGARSTRALVQAFLQRSADVGCRLAVMSEYAESRREDFYRSVGLDLLEDIIVYELDDVKRTPDPPSDLNFTLFRTSRSDDFERLLELDHAAFPWLWWNSRDEFEDYLKTPGVTVELGWTSDGELAAYIGTTALRNWGHLDRIAVHPRFQRRGFGRQSLDQAVLSLVRRGCGKVALSTQARNRVSRALYDSYGFHRSKRHDYRIWGAWLGDASEEAIEQDEG